MLNQVAAEALYSATYLEDYLDSVENLPNDLQRHLSRLRELDVGYQAILRDLDHFELQLLKGPDGERDETSMASENGGTEAGNNSSNGANFRKRIMQKLQTALLSSMEIGDEKIQVVQALQDVVENKTRQLETDGKNLEFGREQENTEPVKETTVKEGSNTQTGERQSKRVRRSKVEPNNDSQDGSASLPAAAAPAVTPAAAAATTPLAETKTAHRKTSSASGSGVAGSVGKKKKRKAKVEKERSSSPPDFPIDPDEPTYCLCDQVSYGEMIGCDNDLCPIEWFHFSCVSLTTKPKGKWYCPKCRGDRPTVMKPKAQFLKELERYNREREEKA